MGVALDILLPVLVFGLIGYARHNKSFSEPQKNGITVVFLAFMTIYFAVRIWP